VIGGGAVKTILVLLGVVVVVLAVTVTGYMIIMDISLVDALYMTVITLSTVGYSEVAEMDQTAKIWSVLVIITNLVMLGYVIRILIGRIGDNLVNHTWRKRKMKHLIDALVNHVIICGAGETGIHVIRRFIERDIPCVTIENDPETISLLEEMGALYVKGDATREQVQNEAGITRAKALIATLSTDADNVYAVLTAKDLNPKIDIIAKAHDESSARKLKRAGANNTVSPNEIGGKKMASMIIKPSLSDFVDHIIETKNVSLDISDIRIMPGSPLVGTMLKDARISEKTGLIVLAIRRIEEDAFLFNPKADERLKVSDHMIVIGEASQIGLLKELAGHV
jgi:voltage-gated potassium channel